jgi:hypothetical protein
VVGVLCLPVTIECCHVHLLLPLGSGYDSASVVEVSRSTAVL